MIVLDASAALSALLNDGSARRIVANEQLHAPHLIDSEVASGLHRQVGARRYPEPDGRAALNVWQSVGLTRYGVHPLLARVWELRDSLSAYDAGYVALAESLDCSLLTADARLGRAPGARCPITVVPG